MIDGPAAEDEIEAQIEDTLEIDTTSVECPADISVGVGETFECTVEAAPDGSLTAKVKIRNDQADLEIRKIG